jgi:predicted small secreted protein
MMKKQYFLATILAVALILLSACNFSVANGSGKVISQQRQVSGFSKVALSGIGQLIITQGNTESLTIDAEDNVLPQITTNVVGDTLHIDLKNDNFQDNVIPTKPIVYHLAVKNIDGIQISGAGSVDSANLTSDNLSISSSGAGSIHLLTITAQSVSSEVSGVGGIELSGKVTSQSINISGSGSYNAPDLESQTATVVISGAGGATVWAKTSLDVTISGAGSVNYYDTPTITKNISGVGSVTSRGNH